MPTPTRYKLKPNWCGTWNIYYLQGNLWVKCKTLEDFQGALSAAIETGKQLEVSQQ